MRDVTRIITSPTRHKQVVDYSDTTLVGSFVLFLLFSQFFFLKKAATPCGALSGGGHHHHHHHQHRSTSAQRRRRETQSTPSSPTRVSGRHSSNSGALQCTCMTPEQFAYLHRQQQYVGSRPGTCLNYPISGKIHSALCVYETTLNLELGKRFSGDQ